VIADRPQTIVWAFTLSSRTSIWRFMAILPSVETLFSITPLHGEQYLPGLLPALSSFIDTQFEPSFRELDVIL